VNIWRVPYPKFGDGPGLERVSAVAARLEIDLAAFGVDGAVIVGSNGKGSTAAMCASILTRPKASDLKCDPRLGSGSLSHLRSKDALDSKVSKATLDFKFAQRPPSNGGEFKVRCFGARVGLFTSPHLLRLNERFRVDGEDIPDDELAHHWARVAEVVRVQGLSETLGGFEFLFLIAASWFQERQCAHTVWEAGIGGRLDPVRLIEARRLALTALDLEHTALLGDTLEQIACDKADAAPAGAKLYTTRLSDSIDRALDAHCSARAVRVERIAPGDFAAPLAGAHQASNAALAVALALDIAPIDFADVSAGLAATRWPGRLELIERAPDVIIDVGHTPRGVAAALGGFEGLRNGRPAVLVCGVSRDKDAGAIVSILAPAFDVIVCVAAHHKGAPAGEIALLARQANSRAEIVVSDSITDARRIARTRAGLAGGVVYVAGGLFLAAEFNAVALGIDPTTLNFF
jgi:dihydrofolate synthase/folylpolyglutamate synthase